MSTRLLHVVRSLRRETGGIAEAVRNLAGAQRRRGDRVAIASLDPADAGEPELTVLGRASHGYGRSAEFVPWVRAHAGEFDAVLVHGLWQYQTFGAWQALRDGATPYLLYPHGMLDVWFKRAHPLKHVKKWLYWPWADYRAVRDAAAVCFTAEDERVRARESFWLYRARERVAPIGIAAPAGDAERERAAFFAAHPALRGREFLLFLGRVHPKKGVELLVQGYAQARQASPRQPLLAIAGPCDDAAYRARIEAEARALGVSEAIVWLPMLAGDVKWGALRACEAFALISHQENFGVAVVEALACGRPALLSDQIAIAGEIAGDGAGFVAGDTAAGAADVLRRWLTLDAAGRAAMGTAARSCFARRYEIGRAAEILAGVIADVRKRA